MKIGLFGYPGVGKSTLASALTGAEAPTNGSRRAAHTGVARVPDPRLEQLAEMYKPKKVTPASVEFVDLVGFRREDSSAAFDVEALKTADALAHVLRAFDSDVPHTEGEMDPARDVATMETELILADHAVLERRAERLQELLRKKGGNPEERAELALIERCLQHLSADRPLRTLALEPVEQRCLRGYGLLSSRPLLLVVNVGEDRIDTIDDPVAAFGLEKAASDPQVAVCAASAQIEMEVSRLHADDVQEFMEDLGLEEPASRRIIRSSYALLGLDSFFTVGEDECRAWTIRRGTAARQAAGTIHSDLERGFIRAEVVCHRDLLQSGSLAKARERGLLRLEGKDYRVSDGEVVHFRFNV
jgi:GTP-binding protein YchF